MDMASRVNGIALAYRWIGKMHNRFGNAEKQQANTHAGAEQHGEP
jgi:hypothetical protein